MTAGVLPQVPIARHPPLELVTQLLSDAGLPTSDLTAAKLAHFHFAGTVGEPQGVVGLELHGEDALLRSLAVAASARQSGLGTALMEQAERHAREHGVRHLYLLTTTAESFFARHGYEPADRSSAPAAIRSTREFSALCPASAAFMVKAL